MTIGATASAASRTSPRVATRLRAGACASTRTLRPSPTDLATSSSHIVPTRGRREDVAEVLVQALRIPAYRGRSFDIRSRLEGEGPVTTDFEALIEKLGGANCDYELGETA